MTEIKFNIDEAIKKAEKAARDAIDSNIGNATYYLANSLTRDNRKYGGKEGIGHEILRTKMEEYVLSDAFSKKLDEIIEKVAEEEMTAAVRALLNSKTRKHLFEATA